MATLSLRLGETLQMKYQEYYKTVHATISKSQAVQYLLIKYLERPSVYSVLEVRELREPMKYSMSLTLPEELQTHLAEFSDKHGLKASEVVRMAIYQELILNGDR